MWRSNRSPLRRLFPVFALLLAPLSASAQDDGSIAVAQPICPSGAQVGVPVELRTNHSWSYQNNTDASVHVEVVTSMIAPGNMILSRSQYTGDVAPGQRVQGNVPLVQTLVIGAAEVASLNASTRVMARNGDDATDYQSCQFLVRS